MTAVLKRNGKMVREMVENIGYISPANGTHRSTMDIITWGLDTLVLYITAK